MMQLSLTLWQLFSAIKALDQALTQGKLSEAEADDVRCVIRALGDSLKQSTMSDAKHPVPERKE